ncbi:MAG: hypothetical protein Q8P41_29985 [Pseudomonadota bacterium]|nr:hypothetical protein [Pseudomonadota bacterium]
MTTASLWALVTFTAAGECLVDRTSLRASLQGFDGDPSFGADDFGDDDFGDDDLGDDDLGDDLGDDDLGDDDLGDDDLGDEIGLTPKQRRARRVKRRQNRLARKNKRLQGRLKKARKGKIVERNVTVTGTVATAVGQSMSVTLTPRTSLHLSKIFATGDTAATINTIISGDDPVVLDNLDAALISPTAYHGPSFGGRILRAGVPVTINYTAGSTTTALKLSFYGKARVKTQRC